MKRRTLTVRFFRNKYGSMKAPLRAVATSILLGLTLLGTNPANATLGSEDARLYREAFKAAERGQFPEARRAAARAREDLPAKVIRWMELTASDTKADFKELREFLDKNPEWPNQAALRRNAEARMPDLSATQVLEWFAKYPAVTTGGFLRHVDALMELKRSDEAIRMVRDRYVNGTLGSVEERDFRKRFNSLLRPEDHWSRTDRLLWDGDEAAARRMLPLLDKGRQHLVLARIALANMDGGVESAIRKVPASLSNDPGLVYERLRWRRKKDLTDGALELLAKPPKALVRPDAWWTERHILARRLIEQGKYARAYDLAASHGSDGGLAFAQAEFLAGWLSLRFLDKPDRALKHFETLYRGVSSPISRSRGAYWAGRAAEALGDKARTKTWYDTAALYGTSFYGMLAAEKVGMSPANIVPRDAPLPENTRESYEKKEMVRLVRMLHRIEGPRGKLFELFIRRLASNAKTVEEYRPLAAVVLDLDREDLAVTIARQALQDGAVLVETGFPILDRKLPTKPEAALVHAIIRQESTFDPDAVSVAGARGLMQIMPATGQHVAKKLGLKHTKEKLTDPDHNVRLGTTYLQELVERFGGSYVLAIASYNAGQGRVAGWLKDIGDPRSQTVDVVDWIELMPIYETRNYVQRVLENLQVYRVRMGLPPIPLTQDLNRAAGGSG